MRASLLWGWAPAAGGPANLQPGNCKFSTVQACLAGRHQPVASGVAGVRKPCCRLLEGLQYGVPTRAMLARRKCSLTESRPIKCVTQTSK
jgi:hypothetical protein